MDDDVLSTRLIKDFILKSYGSKKDFINKEVLYVFLLRNIFYKLIKILLVGIVGVLFGLNVSIGRGFGLNQVFAAGLSKGLKERPNFVLFLVDDLGWKDLGCYGSDYYETPNIDKLAAQGIKFTDAYAGCAVCSPTRAEVLTGRYSPRTEITDWINWRHRVIRTAAMGLMEIPDYQLSSDRRLICPRNKYWLNHKEITIPEVLKKAGYISCHIGKWHLGPSFPCGVSWHPDDQGFDYNIGGCDFGSPPSYFDPYIRELRGRIPTLNPRKEGEYLTDRNADEAEKFIRKHRDNPFFLYFASYAVHTPIQGKDEYVEKFEAKKGSQGQSNPIYASMIKSVDDAMGRILSVLRELGLEDNTVVIFTSDNGGLLKVTSNNPLKKGKGYAYEGGIRVPFIVRWPGFIEPGSVSSKPIISIDIFPTILDMAGLGVPEDRTIDGVSLVEHFKTNGKKELARDAIFWHFPHYRGGDVIPYSIIRKGKWKLIKRYEGKTYELFNLQDDLSEEKDLSSELPEKVSELDSRLTNWLIEVGAKLPKRNSNFKNDN